MAHQHAAANTIWRNINNHPQTTTAGDNLKTDRMCKCRQTKTAEPRGTFLPQLQLLFIMVHRYALRITYELFVLHMKSVCGLLFPFCCLFNSYCEHKYTREAWISYSVTLKWSTWWFIIRKSNYIPANNIQMGWIYLTFHYNWKLREDVILM